MKLYLSDDYIYNAGLAGICHALGIAPETDFLELSPKDLGAFSRKYFESLIQKNKGKLNFFPLLKYAEESNSFTENSLEELNEVIEMSKTFAASQTYSRHYPAELLESAGSLKKIKKESEASEQISILKELASFYSSESAFDLKCQIITYKVIYKVIKDISIVSPKKVDNYVDEFDEYFVRPAVRQLETSLEKKTKGHCILCDSPVQISDTHVISTAFVRGRGFDHRRKTSNVWDFNNYMFICPLCRLVYACAPLAFTYINNDAIFINNSSSSLKSLIEVNKAIPESNSVELALYNSKHLQSLADVQVVFQRGYDYETLFLKPKTLNILSSHSDELLYLQKKSYKSGGGRVYLFEETISRILKDQELLSLVENVLYEKIKQKDAFPFDVSALAWILKINNKKRA